MKSKPLFLLLLVFVSGMTTMAVEMCASRLLDPYFGNSLIIWTVLIGLILIYLTVGYTLGGRLADRSPHETTLYQLTAWAGFAIGLIPFVSRPVLRYAMAGFAQYDVGLLADRCWASCVLFAAAGDPAGLRVAVRHPAGGARTSTRPAHGRQHLRPVDAGQHHRHLHAGPVVHPEHRHATHVPAVLAHPAAPVRDRAGADGLPAAMGVRGHAGADRCAGRGGPGRRDQGLRRHDLRDRVRPQLHPGRPRGRHAVPALE